MSYITNAWGSTVLPSTQLKVTLRDWWGDTITPSLPILNTVSHLRNGKSSNKRMPLAGTSTLWIPPASYTRGQRQYWNVVSGKSKTPAGNMTYAQPCYQAWLSWGYDGGYLQKKQSGFYGNASAVVPDLQHPDIRNLIHEVEVKALNDISGAKAQLGEAIATSAKTADMFIDTATNLAKIALAVKNGQLIRVGHLARNIRKLNVHQLKRLTKEGKIPQRASSAWLQFWYGWKPLVQDAYGLYELLTEELKPAQLVHGRGQSKLIASNEWTTPRSGSMPGIHVVETTSIKARMGLTALLQSPKGARGLNSAGLLNPAALAWELIPFSFVVDWFTPIGPVLQALTATTGLEFVGGYQTVKYSREIVAQVTPNDSDGPPAKSMDSLSGFVRLKKLGFPFPVPYSRPFYSGADRIATISSLLVQLLK